MRGPTVAIVGGLVFIVLCVACVLVHGAAIERDLLQRASAALAVRELPEVAVSFDGRDATLAGTVSSEARRADAELIVAEVAGVRTVRNGLVVERAPAGDEPLREKEQE